jgi:hypothetical protein
MICLCGLTLGPITSHRCRPRAANQRRRSLTRQDLLALRLILLLTSRVAFCGSPICPTSRLIVLAVTKQRCGGRSAKLSLPLRPSTAANHKNEGAVCTSATINNLRPQVEGITSVQRPTLVARGEGANCRRCWVATRGTSAPESVLLGSAATIGIRRPQEFSLENISAIVGDGPAGKA